MGDVGGYGEQIGRGNAKRKADHLTRQSALMRFYFAMWRTNWYTRLTLSSGISDTIFSISFSNFSFGVILHHPPSLCHSQSELCNFSNFGTFCSLCLHYTPCLPYILSGFVDAGKFVSVDYYYRTLVPFFKMGISPKKKCKFSVRV